MGLKEISFAPFKSGKTVHAVSATQLGGVGYIDTEFHARAYLQAHPKIKSGQPPFGLPMTTRKNLSMCRDNPAIAEAFNNENPVFLFETMDLGTTMAALQAYSLTPEISTIVLDSGSLIWDLIGDIADTLHDESAKKNAARGKDEQSTLGRLAWNKPKKYNRRLFYACMRSGKHIIITSHVQESWKESDGKLVLTGVKPWLEKKSPHWADLIIEFAMPEAKMDTGTGKMSVPVPSIKIVGENLGGGPDGKLVKGTVLRNPTFKTLVDLSELHDTTPVRIYTEEELEYMSRSAVERTAAIAADGLTDEQEDNVTYPHGRA